MLLAFPSLMSRPLFGLQGVPPLRASGLLFSHNTLLYMLGGQRLQACQTQALLVRCNSKSHRWENVQASDVPADTFSSGNTGEVTAYKYMLAECSSLHTALLKHFQTMQSCRSVQAAEVHQDIWCAYRINFCISYRCFAQRYPVCLWNSDLHV